MCIRLDVNVLVWLDVQVYPWQEGTLTLVEFFICAFILFRFEMPYNIWCGGCNSMIAKGVRFNAEKKQVGNYYSTKVRLRVFPFSVIT